MCSCVVSGWCCPRAPAERRETVKRRGWAGPWLMLCVLCVLCQVWLCGQTVAGQQHCEQGWFGPDCGYKCRCKDDMCTPGTGRCLSAVPCLPGWFGPSCQYKDAVTGSENVPPFLSDNNDSTCNSRAQRQLLLQLPLLVGWFRLVARDPKSVKEIELDFDGNVSCQDQGDVLVDLVTRDINCSNRQFVSALRLRGNGVRNLCSFYASLGRNVALKQPTWQTGILDHDRELAGPQNAVDGQTDHRLSSRTCTHTAAGYDSPATWTLSFTARAYLINRIVIYNRVEEGFEWRLRGFRMDLYDSSLQLLKIHVDRLDKPQAIYVLDLQERQAVRQIQLQATDKYKSYDFLLNFCEVEIFGEAACAPGEYGPDCEYSCPFCQEQRCLVSTGGCTACPHGKLGQHCQQACPAGRHGDACAERCGRVCFRGGCQADSGYCLQCNSGSDGQLCQQKCQAGFFGPGCVEQCSSTCGGESCHHLTGACHSCTPGYVGSSCQQVCPAGHYGNNCSQPCSSQCYQGQCRPQDGVCYSCWPGYVGAQCQRECDQGTYGDNCSFSCPLHCPHHRCHHLHGHCLHCQPDHTGQPCHRAPGETFGESGPQMLFVLLLLLVLLLLTCVLLARTKTEPRDRAWDTRPE